MNESLDWCTVLLTKKWLKWNDRQRQEIFYIYIYSPPSSGGSAWEPNINTKTTGIIYIQYFEKNDLLSLPLPAAFSALSFSIFLMNDCVSGTGPEVYK